jgi:hypothetical protein
MGKSLAFNARVVPYADFLMGFFYFPVDDFLGSAFLQVEKGFKGTGDKDQGP